jgi:N-acyl-D-amino-acid deacylase
VKILLAKGADTKLKADEETAAEHAARRGSTAVARLLGAAPRTASAAALRPAGQRPSVAEAITPAFALLAKQSSNFIRVAGCNSCHAQDLPSAAAALARDRGLPAPKSIEQVPEIPNIAERLMNLNTVALSGINWELFDLGMNHAGRNDFTDAAVRYILSQQSADGHWHAVESRRPPMNSGSFQATALAVYAIQQFGRPEDKATDSKAVARAMAWLESAHATNTQDMAYRLMGLRWSNASGGTIAAATKQLAVAQLPNGGWKQLPDLEADAYATGMSLYALAAAGNMPTSSSTYQKGIDYLLRTQAADGAWHVSSRSIWLQPYFESGFPYGYDQFISAAGTSWAVMALVSSEPARPTQAVAGVR